jgi:release factor glutamine methyltransferase
VKDAPRVLTAGGWLLLEHGYQQSQAVQNLMEHAGFTAISAHQDFGQQDRVVMGQWP